MDEDVRVANYRKNISSDVFSACKTVSRRRQYILVPFETIVLGKFVLA